MSRTNEYEWPTELDIDEPEPASASLVLPALQRIREHNQRHRKPTPIGIQLPPTRYPEDSELSLTAFFAVIAAEVLVVWLVARLLVWLLS